MPAPGRRLVVHHAGQRPHEPAEDVEVHRLCIADQDQQRRRLPHHPGHRQQDAGDDAGQPGGQDHPGDGLPLGDAQRVAGLAQIHRDDPQHLLGGPHDHRQHQQDQRQRHRELRARQPQRGHAQRIDEQRRHDRRHPAQDVHHERGQPAERGAAAVLDQIDGHHQADRDGDRRAHQSLQHGADQRVIGTAPGHERGHPGLRVRPPHGRGDRPEPLDDHRAQHHHQRGHRDQQRQRNQHGRNGIRGSTASGQRRERPRLERAVQHRGHGPARLPTPATAPRARASTTKVSTNSVSPAAM